MKIKLSDEQYKKLINEIGGYDDERIRDESIRATIKSLMKNYLMFRSSMDDLISLKNSILRPDELREDLSKVIEGIVDPINEYTEIVNSVRRQLLMLDIDPRNFDPQKMEDDLNDFESNMEDEDAFDPSLNEGDELLDEGKKDACYYKVKSRYKVWPSAYASGALVKCRKVGAKNWGNSKKKKSKKKVKEIGPLDEKRKLTQKPGSESSLRDWFKRKGAKGSTGGWVDCNAPDGKGGYKPCGRKEGEKRKKYPACRPTPGACKKYKKTKGKSWGKKAAKGKVSESLNYHLTNNIPLNENIFRYGSKSQLDLINEGRILNETNPNLFCDLEKELFESDLGKVVRVGTKFFPLDLPMVINEAEYKGREVELNKPKRGGSKKFFVYVNDPKTGDVKRVEFGDTTGLSVKLKDPKRRKAFSDRHNCPDKKDKTTPGYWSCRIGRYWKSLGGDKNYGGYW